MPFKLSSIYTERVFALATPPFHENYRFQDLISRNMTPPYLSTTADIVHHRPSTANPVLVLASDGLIDLFSKTKKTSDITQALSSWPITTDGQNTLNLDRNIDILFDALDGFTKNGLFSELVPGESSVGSIDDTTVISVIL
ncbi:hypothetical protein K435DRAFT_872634 [Dendrothele bispora CBS 962.96]|uniref:PPM-type phosphatase domain-containing protein n=1 Tax=Dendrothele bispora (strain CBS 962.96) TaxID=1314807 RepID=A0A4S8L1C4_DENBC|nr:hypothetical protein K435DRAFT_872634 [Dendrothele bispora CBS 962.96]